MGNIFLMDPTDLWQQFRRGDFAARDGLLRHYLPLIRSASAPYAVPGVLAEEDLLSEGMLAANRALDECQPTWNPEAWIRTAVQNRCRSKQRDALRHSEYRGPSLDAPVGEAGGLREEMVGEFDPALLASFGCLRPNQLRVMVMLELQKLTYEEVARACHRSVPQIEATERAARRKLARANGLRTVTKKGKVKVATRKPRPKRERRFSAEWHIRIDPVTRDRLGKLAQGNGVSEAEAVRRLIRAAEAVPPCGHGA